MQNATVIDLTLVSGSLVNKIQDWQIIPDLGSDHLGVLFTITTTSNTRNSNSTSNLRYNTKKADWDLFSKELKLRFKNFNYLDTSSYNTEELDTIASTFTTSIIEAANTSIPKTSYTVYAKP